MIIMGRNKKIGLRVFLLLALIGGVVGIIFLVRNPGNVTEEKTLFQSTFQPNVTYEVHLVENEIYPRVLPEDEIYIKNVVDYIKIDFDALYQASEVVPIHMEYEVIASLIGYNSNTTNRTDYWVKDYSLKKSREFKVENNMLQQQETIQFYFKEYDEFSERANRTTGINLSSEIMIIMRGKISAETSRGTVITPIHIYVTIPLQNNVVTITKGSLQPKIEKLTEQIEHNVPVKNTYIIMISIGIIICVAFLILSFLFILDPLLYDILNKKAKIIVNKYGSRMVALRSLPDKVFNYSYQINSIKDLLILSDEIQKPIYYVIDDFEVVKDYTFYVEDKGDLYKYSLNYDYEIGSSNHNNDNYDVFQKDIIEDKEMLSEGAS